MSADTAVDLVRWAHPSPLEAFEVWIMVLVAVVLGWFFLDLAVDYVWQIGGLIRRRITRHRVRRELEATYAESVRAYRAAPARGLEVETAGAVSGSAARLGRDAGYGRSTSLIVNDPDAPKDINHIERLR